MSKRRLIAAGILVLAALLGCSKGDSADQERASLTQREKDSILAGSQIPGARAVRKTMTVADSAAARAARPTMDSSQ